MVQKYWIYIIVSILIVTAVANPLYSLLYEFLGINYEWSDGPENSETANYKTKDVSNERFRTAILEIVNDYRAGHNLQLMKLGDSLNAQKQAEEVARTNDRLVQIGNHDTVYGWVIYFPEYNNCIPILNPCLFNPRLEGIKYFDDWLNYELHPDEYIDHNPGDGFIPYSPENFLAPGALLLHIGVSIRDKHPMSAFYEIQVELLENKGPYNDSLNNIQGKEFYENGTLSYEGDFQNQRYHGLGKAYYQDGTLAYEGEFRYGLFHGKGKSYYKDGFVYSGDFRNGLAHGQGKEFYKNGALAYEGDFEAGVYSGEGKQYYEDGTLHHEGQFHNGETHD